MVTSLRISFCHRRRSWRRPALEAAAGPAADPVERTRLDTPPVASGVLSEPEPPKPALAAVNPAPQPADLSPVPLPAIVEDASKLATDVEQIAQAAIDRIKESS